MTPLNPERRRNETSGKRLATGLFRKFILADSLALVAITATNVTQVNATGWLWLMLAAYSFQLYFDLPVTPISPSVWALVGLHSAGKLQSPLS